MDLVLQFLGCHLNDGDTPTRKFVDELRTAHAGDFRANRLRDIPARVPEHRCSDTHLSHELSRRQPQGRERSFENVERDGWHSLRFLRVLGYSDDCRAGNGWACTLKRGAAAPREVLPIVSHLSADS